MKKTILIMAAALGSITMVSAQVSDTTVNQQENQYNKTISGNPSIQTYPTRDMKKIKTSEIPSSLRTTLQGTEYTGWENGNMYYNAKTTEYYFQPSGNTPATQGAQSGTATWYRFDKMGKRVQDEPKP